MEELTFCPLCKHDHFKVFLPVEDHFLSHQRFKIDQCQHCGFLFTNPRPVENYLSDYYVSENYISHSGIKKGLINKIYLFARSYRLYKKFNLIASLKTGRSILDIGCGTGELLNYFKQHQWEVSGIEPNDVARAFALSSYGLDVRNESAFAQFNMASFDVITLWHVLEHVRDLNTRLQQINRILKDQGYLIIAVPNVNSFDAEFYGAFWAAYDVPRHLYHFTRKTMTMLVDQNGFTVQSVLPMRLDAYYICILSEKYKTGKPGFIKGLLHGVRSNVHAWFVDKEYSSLIYIVKKNNK
jgi:2-polyprenyl-3-methyl-5-hydroxy-6-metoxy-1,4-benzoquinol methylase